MKKWINYCYTVALIASCPILGPMRNGVITYVTRKGGGEVEIKCHANYTLSGSSRLSCINGEWSSSIPSCKGMSHTCDSHQSRSKEKTNLHGLHLAFPSYRANCICSLPCNTKGPILSQVISLLAFKASCKDPGNPLNWRKIGDHFHHQKTVSFTCQKNYVVEGARTVTCLNGQWSAKRPLCLGEFSSKIMINARSCMLFKGRSFLSFMILSSKRIQIVNRLHSEINFDSLSLLNYSNGRGKPG